MGLFEILKEKRNDNRIIYDIIPNANNERLNRLKNKILELNIDSKYKDFYLSQIKFSSGKFSYEDLYRQVIEYINLLKFQYKNPYINYYPILIDDKTYINNIALFIACLHLNLKPILINCEYIKELDNSIMIDDNSFGICSSGSVKKKLISLSENMLLNSSIKSFKNLSFYSINTINTISGINESIVYPILDGTKVTINNKKDIFVGLSQSKANFITLPSNYREQLSKEYSIEDLDFSCVKLIILCGTYYSYEDIKYLCEKLKIKLNKIYLTYGQTESFGRITGNIVNENHIMSFNILDIIKNNIGKFSIEKKINISNEPFAIPQFEEEDFIALDTKYSHVVNYNPLLNYTNSIYLNNVSIKNYYLDLLSVGKADKCKLDSYPIGEIIYKNQRTNDIGYIDEDNNLYILYRKGNTDLLIQNLLKSRFNLNTYIHRDKETNRGTIILELPNNVYLDGIVYFQRKFIENYKELFENFNLSPFISFEFLKRSDGQKKIINSNYNINENENMYFLKNYEIIFLKLLTINFSSNNLDIIEEKLVLYINYLKRIKNKDSNYEKILNIFSRCSINSIMFNIDKNILYNSFINNKYMFDKKLLNYRINKLIQMTNEITYLVIKILFKDNVEENKKNISILKKISIEEAKKINNYLSDIKGEIKHGH